VRVWLVNPFDPIPGESFRPGRYARICEQLGAAGHEVVWWSSDFFHLRKQKRLAGLGGGAGQNVRIVLLPTPPYRGNISARRLYSHAAFARTFARAVQDERPPDLVLASFPPIGSSWKAGSYASKTGSRVVIDVQDLWPDVFAAVVPGWLRRPFRLCLGPLRLQARRAFGHADGIIGVSQTYLDYGLRWARRPVPSLLLPLGIDLEAFDDEAPVPARSRRERSAVYVGTLGRSYDLRTVIDAAALMQAKRDPIIFHIAGHGPELPWLRQSVERKGLRNVVFHGLLPLRDMANLLRRSMVGLHAIADAYTQTLTNKLFDYMAAGLPVLNSSPGEAAELLASERVGVSYVAGDAPALCRGIETLLEHPAGWQEMSTRARRLAVDRYDRRKVYGRLAPFLESICTA
jgi:glycosyltransferase involved in cell wall biosynthesis